MPVQPYIADHTADWAQFYLHCPRCKVLEPVPEAAGDPPPPPRPCNFSSCVDQPRELYAYVNEIEYFSRQEGDNTPAGVRPAIEANVADLRPGQWLVQQCAACFLRVGCSALDLVATRHPERLAYRFHGPHICVCGSRVPGWLGWYHLKPYEEHAEIERVMREAIERSQPVVEKGRQELRAKVSRAQRRMGLRLVRRTVWWWGVVLPVEATWWVVVATAFGFGAWMVIRCAIGIVPAAIFWWYFVEERASSYFD